MSISIAHFAIGATGGIILLLLFPKIIKNVIKNDVFFIFLSGLWAMIPDLNKFGIEFFQKIHNTNIANIFWLHYVIDVWDETNSIEIAAMFIMLTIIMFFIYYKKLKKKSEIK